MKGRKDNRRLTRSEAIRKKCLSCVGTSQQVSKCCDYDCPLYRYRSGKEERDDLYTFTKRNSSSIESILRKKLSI